MLHLKEISDLVGGELRGDGEKEIHGVNSLRRAGPGEIAFVAPEMENRLPPGLVAGALIVRYGSAIDRSDCVLVSHPQLAFARLMDHFHPRIHFGDGISPQALIDPAAVLDEGVSVGPFSYIGAGTRIGARSEIHAGVIIYGDVTIGCDCLVYSRVVIREGTIIGNEVVIQPGAVIGADGFGFARDETGRPIKIPQVGRVVIGDGCEIGANTCIDRSTMEETELGTYVKLDNLIQIGHNVRVGSASTLCALTGISGSTEIGCRVVLGGQVGVADHASIGDNAMVAAKSGVSGNVLANTVVAGYPQQELSRWRRNSVIARHLDELQDRIRKLEKSIKDMEDKT
jgi:UDP-3-O-[3-hydroxymyristoyl] glucosamine N-acyltransferase